MNLRVGGGIIFLIILGLLFGYGYISLKKEEAEWEAQMEQYRLENRRRTELSEFKAREEKRKKERGATFKLIIIFFVLIL